MDPHLSFPPNSMSAFRHILSSFAVSSHINSPFTKRVKVHLFPLPSINMYLLRLPGLHGNNGSNFPDSLRVMISLLGFTKLNSYSPCLDSQRVLTASFHFVGELLHLFCWSEFTKAFCGEFGPSKFNNGVEALFQTQTHKYSS